jgi:3D (Asp-Asp-Asp) domain-containing protein
VPAGFTPLGEFDHGLYRILNEASGEWQGEKRVEPLLTRDGQLIARVAPTFRRQLDVAGTGLLRDGRVVSLEEKVEGQFRHLVVANAPFGIGAPGYKLIPYRTVSLNPKRIRLGTVLYLSSLAGIRLPNGEVHDGFCFVHDTNDGPTGNELGIFVGFDKDTEGPLSYLTARNIIRVYQVDADTAAVLNRRFKGQFDWSG